MGAVLAGTVVLVAVAVMVLPVAGGRGAAGRGSATGGAAADAGARLGGGSKRWVCEEVELGIPALQLGHEQLLGSVQPVELPNLQVGGCKSQGVGTAVVGPKPICSRDDDYGCDQNLYAFLCLHQYQDLHLGGMSCVTCSLKICSCSNMVCLKDSLWRWILSMGCGRGSEAEPPVPVLFFRGLSLEEARVSEASKDMVTVPPWLLGKVVKKFGEHWSSVPMPVDSRRHCLVMMLNSGRM
ncbi:hypothetical protein Taro_049160 [Colocasia esculenta]|uniref:Uncharacterized protein n=1 Tax=Colocasia esculenta TaxID=4460 RepID=A0A843XA54_COLES|nr:hypothetical protein [Colocasia esculenta]